ncbi:methyltransferase domain-containing protein [Cyanothece sp. BG0011]|uniref:methyltransferase domain-containing protein n=1 Tax=Cyanothece sp. BG0011 TaxID=2082950 RepID=UPI000D1E682E|nr:methyltransferase domain-containing protein [Cyanothece sp. BG0011]
MVLSQITQSYQKEKIANNFSKGVNNYLSHSQVQKHCAEKLLQIAQNYTNSIPKGSILEIGCGTGFVTQELIKQFPNHFKDIIDISDEMLKYCEKNLHISEQQKALIQFRQMDGETIKTDANSYAAIISSFTIQWFQDIVNSLNRLINTLQPQGVLLVAFPNDKSFPEWQKMCDQLNVPFTRNQLPNIEELMQKLSIPPHKIYIYEEQVSINYNNAADFFKSLKIIGAGCNLKQEKLSIPQMKELINYWNHQYYPQKIEVTYDVTFLGIQLI